MKYLDEKDYFETTDINLATTLYLLGFKIEVIDKASATRAAFVFCREKGLDSAIQDFWAKRLVVEPIEFFSALKQVKTRLYQVER